ncbi:MAG: hypothetical protein DRG11_01595 [Epsilonproteobacteria bacterium]|nr:MAG: hypothetical protein DRG11_01595 [Campylobacterota bacterium]
MSELISRIYVKAILNDKEIDTIKKELEILSKAYENKKLLDILSTNISQQEKTKLILSFIKKPNKKTTNLIKLLSSNNRLNVLPSISNELKKQINEKNSISSGEIYSDEALPKKDIEDIEDILSKKFNIKLNLEQANTKFDGLKVTIDSMNIEVGLSKKVFKNRLKAYVLQSI